MNQNNTRLFEVCGGMNANSHLAFSLNCWFSLLNFSLTGSLNIRLIHLQLMQGNQHALSVNPDLLNGRTPVISCFTFWEDVPYFAFDSQNLCWQNTEHDWARQKKKNHRWLIKGQRSTQAWDSAYNGESIWFWSQRNHTFEMGTVIIANYTSVHRLDFENTSTYSKPSSCQVLKTCNTLQLNTL